MHPTTSTIMIHRKSPAKTKTGPNTTKCYQPQLATPAQPQTQFWHLPEDIVHRILEFVPVTGYVHLTRTCTAAKSALGTADYYKTVWNSLFRTRAEAYSPNYAESLMYKDDWESLYAAIVKLKQELQSLYVEVKRERHRSRRRRAVFEKIDTKLRKLNCMHFVPLLFLTDYYTAKFNQAVENKQPHDIFMMCFTRRLLNGHSMFKASKLNSVNASLDYEHILFELSRYDSEFEQVAISRLELHTQIRREMRFETEDRTLRFTSHDKFYKLVLSTSRRILAQIPPSWLHRVNDLFGLEHDESEVAPYHALIVKMLNEELFRKFSIKICDRTFQFDSRFSPLGVVVGKYIYTVNSKTKKLSRRPKRDTDTLLDFNEVIEFIKENSFTPLKYYLKFRRAPLSLTLNWARFMVHVRGLFPATERRSRAKAWHMGRVRSYNGSFGVMTGSGFGFNSPTVVIQNLEHPFKFRGRRLAFVDCSEPFQVKRVMKYDGFLLMGIFELHKVKFSDGQYRFYE